MRDMHLGDRVEDIVRVLRKGGVIVYPTDTIWGIGCNALDTIAVKKVYTIKRRPAGKPFIVLVSNIEMLKQYVQHIHPRVETLLSMHVRPLTMIYYDVTGLDGFQAEDGAIAIRVVQDAFCRELIRALEAPLVSTSANLTGEDYPRKFADVSSTILRKADYVVKHRQDDHTLTKPSVIAKYDGKGRLVFLRE